MRICTVPYARAFFIGNSSGASWVTKLILPLSRSLGQAAVLVFTGKGDIPGKPLRGSEGPCLLLRGKLHLSQYKSLVVSFEDIQLNGERAGGGKGDHIALFGKDKAVSLCEKVMVGLLCQGKVVLLSGEKALTLIGQIVVLIVTADAHHRGGAEVGLLDPAAGVGTVIVRGFFDEKLAFNLHSQSPFVSRSGA